MKRRRLFVAAVVAMGLVAFACSNQKTGPTTSSQASSCTTPAASATAPSKSPTASAVAPSASPSPAASAAMSTKKVVKLGFLGDLSGGNAGLVVSAEKSALLAIKQADAKGDLPVDVELEAKDNKDGLSDTAPALAQQLIGDPAVVGVIGPAFSGETKATGALFCQAGLTDITQSATNPALTTYGWPTFFRALATDAVQGGQAGAYIVKSLQKKTVVVINDKSDYGTGLAAAVVKSIKDNGGDVVLDQGIEPTTDYTTIVDSVLAKKPDVLFYAGYDKDAPLLAKQYRQKGGTALFMGGDGDKGTNFLKEGGQYVEGAVLTCPCLDPNVSTDPAAQTFASDYKAAYNGEAAGIYSAEGWDVANIFIAAIKAAGANPTRKAVLDYVASLKDFKGLSKTFNWSPTHEVLGSDVIHFYKVVGGKYTLLSTPTAMTGAPSATP